MPHLPSGSLKLTPLCPNLPCWAPSHPHPSLLVTPPCPASTPAQFTSVAPALAALFDACRTQPAAVTLILKLAGEVVEQHSVYLSPADAQALCSWALRLLQLYSANNLVRGRGGEALELELVEGSSCTELACWAMRSRWQPSRGECCV